jgi:hypothetical protein
MLEDSDAWRQARMRAKAEVEAGTWQIGKKSN